MHTINSVGMNILHNTVMHILNITIMSILNITIIHTLNITIYAITLPTHHDNHASVLTIPCNALLRQSPRHHSQRRRVIVHALNEQVQQLRHR